MSRRRKKGVSVSTILATILLAIITVAIVLVSLYWTVLREKPSFDEATHCPLVDEEIRPLAHTVILIDKTDVLTPIQTDTLIQFLKQKVNYQMIPGELLSIYALGDNLARSRKPIFEVCKMRRGKDANELYENKRKIQEAFNEKFNGPVWQVINELTGITSSAKESPLFEMIQSIGVNSVQGINVDGPRRLIVFSDMLHNTSRYTMFRKGIKYSDFEKSNYARELKTNLYGVEVELHYFINHPEYQKDMHNPKFWKSYFKSAGAFEPEIHIVGK